MDKTTLLNDFMDKMNELHKDHLTLEELVNIGGFVKKLIDDTFQHGFEQGELEEMRQRALEDIL